MESGGREAWLVGTEVQMHHVYVGGTSTWKQRLSVELGIQDWVSLVMTYLFPFFKFFYGEETQQLF